MGVFFKSLLSKIGGTLKAIDLYGQKINLHYKGKDVFKTYFGGMISVLVIFILLGYAMYLTLVMFERSQIVYSTNSVVRDLSVDHEDHRPAEHGFAIAVGFRFSDMSLMDEESLRMYQIRAYQYSAVTLENGEFNETWDELEMVSCKDNFPFHNKTLLANFLIDNYVCIKPTNYSLVGNWYTPISKSIQIEFHK